MTDTIILSVRLKSGNFESSISFPEDTPPAQRDIHVKNWLDVMKNGLAMQGANVNTSVSWVINKITKEDILEILCYQLIKQGDGGNEISYNFKEKNGGTLNGYFEMEPIANAILKKLSR